MDPLSDNAIWFLSFSEKEKEKQLLDKMSVEKNFSNPKRLADISDEELSQYRGVARSFSMMDGYKVTCYTNKEEVSNELLWGERIRRVEDALREAGCIVETAALPLLPKLVVDRVLVSGENPASADQLGAKFVEMLERKV
ncbi:hypothetical protein BDD12DRAFT_871996 [Trichophaea hybrida]|nr:hypothetical protein BDD12DRAFT_871996 [Trichophaea hybrida]